MTGRASTTAEAGAARAARRRKADLISSEMQPPDRAVNVNAPPLPGPHKILCLAAAAAALVMPTTGRSHPSLDVLARKIDQLGDECPWTAAQRPEDMLFHLRSEVMETEAALREKTVDAEALTKELGDVLFCALLLARVCEREHGASLRRSPTRRSRSCGGARRTSSAACRRRRWRRPSASGSTAARREGVGGG